MAIGANAKSVRLLILREGMMPVLAGTLLGIGCACLFAQGLEAMLFQVSPLDPFVGLGAAAILLCVGVISCLVPAFRAARIAPLQALRSR